MDKLEGFEPQRSYSKEFEDRLIDWITFYRRNPARFVEHYLGISLHFYQKIMIHLMFMFPMVILLCSRASAKSFTTTVFAVAYCILYPNSKVLVTSFTKGQSGLN